MLVYQTQPPSILSPYTFDTLVTGMAVADVLRRSEDGAKYGNRRI